MGIRFTHVLLSLSFSFFFFHSLSLSLSIINECVEGEEEDEKENGLMAV